MMAVKSTVRSYSACRRANVPTKGLLQIWHSNAKFVTSLFLEHLLLDASFSGFALSCFALFLWFIQKKSNWKNKKKLKTRAATTWWLLSRAELTWTIQAIWVLIPMHIVAQLKIVEGSHAQFKSEHHPRLAWTKIRKHPNLIMNGDMSKINLCENKCQ